MFRHSHFWSPMLPREIPPEVPWKFLQILWRNPILQEWRQECRYRFFITKHHSSNMFSNMFKLIDYWYCFIWDSLHLSLQAAPFGTSRGCVVSGSWGLAAPQWPPGSRRSDRPRRSSSRDIGLSGFVVWTWDEAKYEGWSWYSGIFKPFVWKRPTEHLFCAHFMRMN